MIRKQVIMRNILTQEFDDAWMDKITSSSFKIFKDWLEEGWKVYRDFIINLILLGLW